MGNKSTKQQRYENASKTGVFAVEDKTLTSFPSDALKIPSLRILHIENCGLSKLPPDISKAGATLQRLELSRNKLSRLPDVAAALQNLQKLDVSMNVLEELPEPLFAAMAKLKEASLANNRLTAVPSSIAGAASLKVLDLSHNRLRALPDGVGALASLEDLHLSFNALPALPATMAALPRIKRINLESNAVQRGGIPAGLLRDTPLESIKLQGNPMSSVEGEEGAEEYVARSQKHALKNIDTKVKTGDLSAGLGTAEQYANLRSY